MKNHFFSPSSLVAWMDVLFLFYHFIPCEPVNTSLVYLNTIPTICTIHFLLYMKCLPPVRILQQRVSRNQAVASKCYRVICVRGENKIVKETNLQVDICPRDNCPYNICLRISCPCNIFLRKKHSNENAG